MAHFSRRLEDHSVGNTPNPECDVAVGLHTDAANVSAGKAVFAPTISVVIPAYNEEKRIPCFLETVRPYLGQVFADSYEVIVVDDGSVDGTAAVISALQRGWPQLRLERQSLNRGKGAAVRTGVELSRGDFMLFADADGACPVSEEQRLRTALECGADIAVGSRRVGVTLRRERHWFRAMIGWCFSKFTSVITGLDLQDTQCGFKMFRGSVAKELFRCCSRDDYLFDVYVLILAKLKGLRIVEVGVDWQEIPGSHVHLLRDSSKMLAGLITIRHQVRHQLFSAHKVER